uniref:Peroxidase n=2 Tax=Oryza brachyantha TaxID=4533 RepID=J3ME55_ORYBR
MATTSMPRLTSTFLAVAAAALLAGAAAPAVDAAIVDGLQVGFYNRSCPAAEEAVRDVISSEIAMDRTIAAGLIRIFFHDCFITGCDASILLDETPSGDVPEKESSANGFTLHGLRSIDVAKSTVESMCPRTVSCADILAFAARDAAVAAGIPFYEVAAGRRDGTRSNMDDLPGNMPTPSHQVPRMTELFTKRGLTQEDLVVLSGAHSIGGAHCFMFSNRIYGFSQGADIDPALDPAFAANLRRVCPPPKQGDDPQQSPKVSFDGRTSEKLDSTYYTEVLAARGLMSSDDALIKDPQTKPTVDLFAGDDALWQQKFAEAMQKLGAVDVLVGEQQGQIRRECRLVNKQSRQPAPSVPRLKKPRFPRFMPGSGFHGFF